jgi:hypothetical protein
MAWVAWGRPRPPNASHCLVRHLRRGIQPDRPDCGPRLAGLAATGQPGRRHIQQAPLPDPVSNGGSWTRPSLSPRHGDLDALLTGLDSNAIFRADLGPVALQRANPVARRVRRIQPGPVLRQRRTSIAQIAPEYVRISGDAPRAARSVISADIACRTSAGQSPSATNATVLSGKSGAGQTVQLRSPRPRRCLAALGRGHWRPPSLTSTITLVGAGGHRFSDDEFVCSARSLRIKSE